MPTARHETEQNVLAGYVRVPLQILCTVLYNVTQYNVIF
jgi:hypothetical protein